MVRAYSTTIQSQLEADELRPFYLLAVTIGATTYRYTDCDVPIYSGNTYSPRGFQFQSVKYSMGNIVDKATVIIDNVDSAFSGLFVGNTPQGSATTLSVVVLDGNYDVINAAVKIFEGEIDSWVLDESRLKMTITSLWHQWTQQTLSKHSPSCRWKQFGTTQYDECNYTGPSTWCDRTYARCSALLNTTNFGGFPYLPSIVDKDVWWGRIPKNG